MKNCIMLWKNDAVDLAINNQRRAFSDAYNNEVLAESKIYIELSSNSHLRCRGRRIADPGPLHSCHQPDRTAGYRLPFSHF